MFGRLVRMQEMVGGRFLAGSASEGGATQPLGPGRRRCAPPPLRDKEEGQRKYTETSRADSGSAALARLRVHGKRRRRSSAALPPYLLTFCSVPPSRRPCLDGR